MTPLLVFQPLKQGLHQFVKAPDCFDLGFFRIDETGLLTAGSHRGASKTGFATYRVDEDGFHRIDHWVLMTGSQEHAREAQRIREWQAASRGPLYHTEIEAFAADDEPLFFSGAAPAPAIASVVRSKSASTETGKANFSRDRTSFGPAAALGWRYR